MRTASESQVNAFLKEFKAIVTSGRGLFIIPRASNNATITMLGLTRKTVEIEVLSLSVVDYSSGPEADRDQPGEVWIFGKIIKDHEIYIKLKIAEVKETKIAKCISFHEAEFSITYPLKK